MAPLVVLVGKNSTGKSYMASLLWAILSGEGFVARAPRGAPPAPQWFIDYIENYANVQDAPRLNISAAQIEDWVNSSIAERKERDLSRIFSSNQVSAEEISIKLAGHQTPGAVIEPMQDDGDDALARWYFDESDNALNFSIQSGGYSASPFYYLVRRSMLGEDAFEGSGCRYVPAARTGLILALGSLVSESLEGLGNPSTRQKTTLPLPLVRFLQSISRLKPDDDIFTPIAEFLERGILKGSVGAESTYENGPPEYYFHGDNAERLPLYVTSSMITELAPILLSLRSFETPYFVIEEPEAHLHLSAQRYMARAIVRLVNAGAKVVVTTHSDTFLQQLNLSISLGARRDDLEQIRVGHGYDLADTLAPGNARCYEFIPSSNGTVIKEVTQSDDGFAVNSINESLYDLAEEVIAIQSEGAE